MICDAAFNCFGRFLIMGILIGHVCKCNLTKNGIKGQRAHFLCRGNRVGVEYGRSVIEFRHHFTRIGVSVAMGAI